MKIIIAIFFSFVISTYSNELSLEQFKKIIKIKQDKVELVKGLKVLPFGKKTKSTFKYKYPDKDDLEFTLEFEGKTVQGKYLVYRTKFPNDTEYVYVVRSYNVEKKLHINHILYPNGKFYKAYGKVDKDPRKIKWTTSNDDSKGTGEEIVKDGKSITTEKYYDLDGKFLFSSSNIFRSD